MSVGMEHGSQSQIGVTKLIDRVRLLCVVLAMLSHAAMAGESRTETIIFEDAAMRIRSYMLAATDRTVAHSHESPTIISFSREAYVLERRVPDEIPQKPALQLLAETWTEIDPGLSLVSAKDMHILANVGKTEIQIIEIELKQIAPPTILPRSAYGETDTHDLERLVLNGVEIAYFSVKTGQTVSLSSSVVIPISAVVNVRFGSNTSRSHKRGEVVVIDKEVLVEADQTPADFVAVALAPAK